MTEQSAAVAYPHRTRQRLETRDRVFEAAVNEFRRAGVAAAQIEDIVKAAGVARGTFYLHFATKDHVLLELLRRKETALAERFTETRVASTRAFLRRAAECMLADAASEDASLWRELMGVVARHARERDEPGPLAQRLTRFFAEAQGRGDVRSDLTAFEITAVFLPAVYGLLQLKLGAPEAELRGALHRVVDVILRGLSP